MDDLRLLRIRRMRMHLRLEHRFLYVRCIEGVYLSEMESNWMEKGEMYNYSLLILLSYNYYVIFYLLRIR